MSTFSIVMIVWAIGIPVAIGFVVAVVVVPGDGVMQDGEVVGYGLMCLFWPIVLLFTFGWFIGEKAKGCKYLFK